jgi:hypothetical protein
MAFTEFYCDAATGANINAGDNKTVVTSTNGDWGNAAANRFTAASGTPFSGVSVGDFASVYVDGATTAVYIARVTAVNSGGASLTLSSSAKSGTAPSNSATGRSCTVGGKWLGPNGTESFPFGFVNGTMTDASADTVRVNLKDGTNYAITAAMTHNVAGQTTFQGYTSAAGDGGKAIIDGGTSGTSYILLTLGGANCELFDLIFQNNGATGSAAGVDMTGGDNTLCRVVFHDVRGEGLKFRTRGNCTQCEAYNCNQSNTSATGAFLISSSIGSLRDCIAHDNSGSGSVGFKFTDLAFPVNCIADTNGSHGFLFQTGSANAIYGCVAYNNGGSGIDLQNQGAATTVDVSNCILTKNGAYGIDMTGNTRGGVIQNCAFGAGTQANSSGTINNVSAVQETGTVSLTSNVSPFTDAANGDFRLNSTTGGGAACRGAGFGSFTQTASSYAGTVGYPDIGAAQHQDSGSSGGVIVPMVLHGTHGVQSF